MNTILKRFTSLDKACFCSTKIASPRNFQRVAKIQLILCRAEPDWFRANVLNIVIWHKEFALVAMLRLCRLSTLATIRSPHQRQLRICRNTTRNGFDVYFGFLFLLLFLFYVFACACSQKPNAFSIEFIVSHYVWFHSCGCLCHRVRK